MNKLLECTQVDPFKSLFYKILYSFDIMIGHLLNVLDSLRIFSREIQVKVSQ